MATTETISPITNPEHLASLDPNVTVPKHVRDAAKAAEDFYKPAPVADPEPPAESAAAASPEPELAPAPQPEPSPQPPSTPAPGDWEHRYYSMEGRFKQSQRTIGQLQQQMTELGDELVRTQALISQQPGNQPHDQNNSLITENDVETYGNELIDVARRAGLEAVKPELEQLRSQNNDLQKRLARNDQAALFQDLDHSVPNWRTINHSAEFKAWLRLPDIYAGRVRHDLLNEAYKAANAPRVAAFFKGYLAEAEATGSTVPGNDPQPTAQPAPRVAAVPLDRLAAPGRARPAGGDTPSPASKPIFTRSEIAQFYRDVTAGRYQGREADRQRTEAAIFSAQNEGRVR